MANEKRLDLIDRNKLKEKLQEHHDFFVDGVGGFRYLTPKDKARVDEITNCIAEIVNAPTVDAVVLPCKIGDSLWCVYSPPFPANPADKGKWYMGEFEVARFHYGVKGLSIEMYGFGTVAWKEIGKTIFLTREEAEAAIAKMDGGNEDG